MQEHERHALARELAGLPLTVRNLLFEHRRTADGLCRGCTQPGHGLPYRPYPCAIAVLAEEAAAVRAASTARTAA